MLRPACLLFNILCLTVFFILGMYYAGWIDAGKNQGLAGGAIVLGWGVLFAGIALLLSFFITYKVSNTTIVKGNWVLLALLVIASSHTYFRFQKRDKLQQQMPHAKEKPSMTPTDTKPPSEIAY